MTIFIFRHIKSYVVGLKHLHGLQLVRIEKSQAPSSKCRAQNCKWSIYIRDEKMIEKREKNKDNRTRTGRTEKLQLLNNYYNLRNGKGLSVR